ncbi:carbohydrate ABC transporter permease [Breznakiella homolactica]|uniref:Carbohydrate ABC transporter permease n=1 Tax=Breznakiella homolactica TaxID=2798577 RepID=A0A7T7XJ56_9SPIR|nr:carbohydrate ABC transporter permease [Breznakiella homolactica]QQO07389.1 carbohydrate ABC transporter permease [Breznakiella homolactica]
MAFSAFQKYRRGKFGPGEILVFLMLCVGFILVAYPLFWVVMSSLKTSSSITLDVWALPKVPQWKNYVTAWNRGVSGYFVNSLIVTVSTIFGVLTVSSLCAYGLSRFKTPWLKYMLILVMGGMMLNPQVCLIPLYGLLRTLRMHNTYFALIIPYIAFRLPLNTLLIRSFFLAVPKEIEESATIDGCTNLQIYARIFVPMSQPILITGTILTAYYAWNEFLFAIIFIDSNKYRTIPAGLMNFRDALVVDWGPLLAGMTISALPIIIFFISVQKYFIRGMTAGAVKG